MIEGHTNVRSARFGAGAFSELGSELGRFLVTTMEMPWHLAGPRLRQKPSAVLFVENMGIGTIERQLAVAPEVETVLAVGGGQAIDLGKYIAWKRDLRLVSIKRS